MNSELWIAFSWIVFFGGVCDAVWVSYSPNFNHNILDSRICHDEIVKHGW